MLELIDRSRRPSEWVVHGSRYPRSGPGVELGFILRVVEQGLLGCWVVSGLFLPFLFMGFFCIDFCTVVY